MIRHLNGISDESYPARAPLLSWYQSATDQRYQTSQPPQQRSVPQAEPGSKLETYRFHGATIMSTRVQHLHPLPHSVVRDSGSPTQLPRIDLSFSKRNPHNRHSRSFIPDVCESIHALIEKRKEFWHMSYAVV